MVEAIPPKETKIGGTSQNLCVLPVIPLIHR
jgi:hypothetical protein